ncbi:MAG TPA: hypothetical protein DCZ69_05495 [Syntrophobacteraceae bacterium]|nr:hypothetical protein [Syntrophobacteraceae bacterium]HBD07695.1 hypothetical protein [Syntrophobacteraceae bacterium]HBZ53876.1 hypothetical protein [Syntrophobacteraceae bacterium]
MFQLVVVLAVLTLVLVYVIRHYVKVFRADAPTCSGCAASCCHPTEQSCDGADRPTAEPE